MTRGWMGDASGGDWGPDDGPDEEEDDGLGEPDANCRGWFCEGRFVCGAVGSEDCDECSCYWMLGMTARQIQAEEEKRMQQDPTSGQEKP